MARRELLRINSIYDYRTLVQIGGGVSLWDYAVSVPAIETIESNTKKADVIDTSARNVLVLLATICVGGAL